MTHWMDNQVLSNSVEGAHTYTTAKLDRERFIDKQERKKNDMDAP